LKRQAQQFKFSDDIIFKGWLNAEENRSCYSKASVFVSVPDSDATSVSLLEAMSFGCIPVLSNLPANLEWVLDGINGSIVKDLESDFISPVFNLDFEKVIRMNREIISERATKTVSREKFINIYRKALNK
jgi:glycosyltransferase involved in cell wall biosynthesis